ncbi:hypothetical protein [Yersinia mollaretii]|uniref:hypothetical protein n=1 Tax=Yersinia mollaretii TaxID=33060 RepID=UPI00119CD80E|nr:hypothetical protein [Yersinia mollaretii]
MKKLLDSFTTERLKEYAYGKFICNINDEIRIMARIALAVKEAEPIGYAEGIEGLPYACATIFPKQDRYATTPVFIVPPAFSVSENGNTLWPVEVKLYFNQVPAAAQLPIELQNLLLGNINRMKLEGISPDAIIASATTLARSLGEQYE